VEWSEVFNRQPGPSSDAGLSSREAGRRITVYGLATLVVGVGAGMLIAGTADGGPFWSDGLLLGSYVLAAAAGAALLGLVFAIPRARADTGEGATGRFVSNSNLEQISDWLTKILVGAGLVQLAALPGALRSLGDYLGGNLRVPNGATASVSLTIYGAGVGFLLAYLWGRLRFRVLLEASERDAEDQAHRQLVVASSLAAATSRSGETVSATSIADAAAHATATVTRASRRELAPVLWVDDHPENNENERRALEALSINVDKVTSTAQALPRLSPEHYGLIITDLGREEEGEDKPDAGVELIREVRKIDRDIPIAVYAGSRAFRRRDELRAEGATAVFNRATDLIDFVTQTLVA
jgi:CheY-like chemotaxis protein